MKALLLAAFACANPSPLDTVGPETDPLGPWTTIATRARPLDSAGDALDAALLTHDLDKQAAALEAWARAGGRWLHVPNVRAINSSDDAIAISSVALDLVKAHPTDDAVIESSLYLAQRLRRDGNDLLTAMAAVAVTRGVIYARPQAPAWAARYAPTDEEVVRLFEAEAMAVSRLVAWAATDDGQRYGDARAGNPLPQFVFLADVPADRAGFLREIRLHARGTTANLPMYADKLFGAVDDYRGWLERSGQPDAAAARDRDRR